ncbi:MAG: TetR/AcrR family transcriptional regulator [Pyrinomonadaceae bacterium]|nr:TetR/AcrR family transcriptional regulator [Pyrinomonadaceae bacterium]
MSSEKTDTRTKILEATRKLMMENIGSGVKMIDIAGEAGVSRQALYLHFDSRSELLIAATKHLDEKLGVSERYSVVDDTNSGIDRLDALVEFWGNYLPHIHGIAKALYSSRESDEAAAAAWKDRMDVVKRECRNAIIGLKKDGLLRSEWSQKDATEFLWAMLSFPNWELLRFESGWSVKKYVSRTQVAAKQTFVKEGC